MSIRPAIPLLVFTLVQSMPAQPGSIDPTFGNAGIVTTDASAGSDVARDGLLLPDGRIVVCGAGNSQGTFLLLRYHQNGTVDSSFGTNGVVMTAMGGTGVEATAIVRQTDGRLLAAGHVVNGGTSFSVVVRYDSTGALDFSFGASGKAIRDIGTGGEVKDVVLQPDGKILVAGTFRSGSTLFMGLHRYKANGTPDSTFGFNGTVTRGPGVENHCSAIALQHDGRIVAAGTTDQGAGSRILLFRFNSNGTPDSTFGTVGRTITTVSAFPNFGMDVALRDSHVVVAGYAGIAANLTHRFAVVRYTSRGLPDSTFGTAGIALTPEIGLTTGFAFLNKMLILQSGKILLTGQGTNLPTSDDFVVARMKSTGAMDSTFGADGIVYTNITGNGRDVSYQLLHQPDGNIIALGQGGVGALAGGAQVSLVRYLNDELPTAVVNPALAPAAFSLDQNFPNPFNPTTRIRYTLRRGGFVTLTLFDMIGRRVSVLADGMEQAGAHEVTLDARNLAAGAYIYRLQSNGSAVSRMLMFVK